MISAGNILTAPTKLPKSKIVVLLEITGEPLSKQRPRLALKKSGKVYTPKTTEEAQEYIGWAIKKKYRDILPDTRSAFGVRVFFHCGDRQRRDVDNMAKLVFDACTGLVWKDDSQVEELISRVVRGSDCPRTELVIYTIASTSPYIKCVECGKEKRIYPSWSLRKYCSRTRLTKALTDSEVVACDHCGKTFERRRHRIRTRGGKQFCTKRCFALFRQVELTCCRCGKLYMKAKCKVKSKIYYCSIECREASWRERRRANRPGSCLVCGGGTTRKEYTRCMPCKIKQTAKLARL